MGDHAHAGGTPRPRHHARTRASRRSRPSGASRVRGPGRPQDPGSGRQHRAASRSASTCADRCATESRTGNVRNPRSARYASKGPRDRAELGADVVQLFKARTGDVTIPSSRSEWPPMNLVALWIAKSAPKYKARWSSGVANVPSTATAQGRCAQRNRARRSRPTGSTVFPHTGAQHPRRHANVAAVSVVSTPTNSIRPADGTSARAASASTHSPTPARRRARQPGTRSRTGRDRRHARRERDGTNRPPTHPPLPRRASTRETPARVCSRIRRSSTPARAAGSAAHPPREAPRPAWIATVSGRSSSMRGTLQKLLTIYNLPATIRGMLRFAVAVRSRRRDRGRGRGGPAPRSTSPRPGRRSSCSSATSWPAARRRRRRADCARSSRTR